MSFTRLLSASSGDSTSDPRFPFPPLNHMDRRSRETLTLRFGRDVPDAEHDDGFLGERGAVPDLRPVVAVAVAGENGEGHAREAPTGRRLRRVEVGMSVDPYGPGARMIEAAEDAVGGHAGSGQ